MRECTHAPSPLAARKSTHPALPYPVQCIHSGPGSHQGAGVHRPCVEGALETGRAGPGPRRRAAFLGCRLCSSREQGKEVQLPEAQLGHCSSSRWRWQWRGAFWALSNWQTRATQASTSGKRQQPQSVSLSHTQGCAPPFLCSWASKWCGERWKAGPTPSPSPGMDLLSWPWAGRSLPGCDSQWK